MQDTTFSRNLFADNTDDEILAILKLEKTILDSNKPLLRSQCEAMLLRTSTLLNLDAILMQTTTSQNNLGANTSRRVLHNEFFKDAWEIICGILTSALFKRPSYLVKSRVPLAVSVFRNLLFGLARVSDQNLCNITSGKNGHLHLNPQAFNLSQKELENMSHNLDRCLDLIRGDKLKEHFAGVAPYMIADILEAAFAGQVTVIPNVKKNLLSGMYKVCFI